MSNWYKIRGSTLSAIANAIRNKTGNEDDPMTPLEMPDEINSIIDVNSLPAAEGMVFHIELGGEENE